MATGINRIIQPMSGDSTLVSTHRCSSRCPRALLDCGADPAPRGPPVRCGSQLNQIRVALPTRFASGTKPQTRPSSLLSRLSPIIRYCPGGTTRLPHRRRRPTGCCGAALRRRRSSSRGLPCGYSPAAGSGDGSSGTGHSMAWCYALRGCSSRELEIHVAPVVVGGDDLEGHRRAVDGDPIVANLAHDRPAGPPGA